MASRETFIKQYRITNVQITLVSMTSVVEEQIDVVDEDSDPYHVVQRKIGRVMELLDCSEEEAERLVLSKR